MRRPERPSAVLVVAILQICFGSLALLGSLCGGGLQLAGGARMFAPPPGAQAPPDVEGMIRARVPYYTAMQYGGAILGTIAGAVMIISAIGLLKMRPWARGLTIGYACYNIISTIVSFVFALTVTLPVTKELFEEMRADPKFPPQMGNFMTMMESMTRVITYASLAFLAYPIALLIVMFLPHVREAFRAAAHPRPDDEEYEDEDYDDEADAAGKEAAARGETPSAAPPEERIQPGEDPGERGG
jgi:hypothetical protein